VQGVANLGFPAPALFAWAAALAEFLGGLLVFLGLGTRVAAAFAAFTMVVAGFARHKAHLHFAAWLGLVPKQHSTGGKQRLGKTSKMGQRDIRRLLVIGATAVIRWASRRGAPKGSWLARMLERKPIPVVAVALTNKMARGIWAMLTRGETYRGPVLIGA